MLPGRLKLWTFTELGKSESIVFPIKISVMAMHEPTANDVDATRIHLRLAFLTAYLLVGYDQLLTR